MVESQLPGLRPSHDLVLGRLPIQRRLRIGGPDQVRTDDLLNAIEALFQLSYEPIRTGEG